MVNAIKLDDKKEKIGLSFKKVRSIVKTTKAIKLGFQRNLEALITNDR